jgi:pyridoxamine 5'-phosphate oxidase family protein
MARARFAPDELSYLREQRLGRLATVDDLASTDPWPVRGVEIRGPAEARRDVDPPRPGVSRELITIHPEQIRSWGLSES